MENNALGCPRTRLLDPDHTWGTPENGVDRRCTVRSELLPPGAERRLRIFFLSFRSLRHELRSMTESIDNEREIYLSLRGKNS